MAQLAPDGDQVAIRDMTSSDLAAVARIEKAHAAAGPRRLQRERMTELLRDGRRVVALVAVDERGRVVAYLVGDVRAWEFGSETAGWVFAIAVDPRAEGRGVGRHLVDEAARRFAALGVKTVRTMVRRDDVRVLRFFRSAGYAGGPYLELERKAGEP